MKHFICFFQVPYFCSDVPTLILEFDFSRIVESLNPHYPTRGPTEEAPPVAEMPVAVEILDADAPAVPTVSAGFTYHPTLGEGVVLTHNPTSFTHQPTPANYEEDVEVVAQ